MKLFIAKGYHLASLAPLAKVVYTFFLAFTALGLWTSWEIYAQRIGPDLDGPAGAPSVMERYAPSASREEAAAPSGGPTLELDGLPPEPTTPAAAEDVKGPWVLDVFHQHAFSVSVVFLILAHLFMLTRLAPWLAGATIVLAGLSALAHVLAPVLIHATGAWAWLMPASGAAMGLSWTFMTLWSLAAMWLGVGARRDEDDRARPAR